MASEYQAVPLTLGPFAVTKVLKEGATYQLDLSEELLKRGINRAFHASLLKPHVPNDDRRFPGRLPSQLPGFCQGCSLRLTGTRGLVVEGGVERVVETFRS